ncbi:hypothetical protein ACKS0A_03410 [Histoplasma ohiense]
MGPDIADILRAQRFIFIVIRVGIYPQTALLVNVCPTDRNGNREHGNIHHNQKEYLNSRMNICQIDDR